MTHFMPQPARAVLLICLLLGLGTAARAEVFGRAQRPADAVSLNGKWNMFLTGDPGVAPPYPASGKAETVDITPQSGEAQGWTGHWEEQYTHAWYERKIDLPAAWDGRRVLLAVDRCRWEARVFLNGKPVGTHLGMSPFVLDVTDAAKPRQENDLLIVAAGVVAFLKDRDKDLDRFTPDERKEFLTAFGKNMASSKLTNRWLYRQFDDDGGYKLGLEGGWFYSEPQVYMPDAFVKTSVRAHRLSVETTVRNRSAGDAACIVSGKVIDADGKVVLILPAKPALVTAGGDAVVTLDQQWADPRLWDTDDPYMYTLVCELSQDGKTVATRETPFGFREFWAQGNQFVLNGKRIHLFSQFQIYDPTAHLKELRAQGYNALTLVGGRLRQPSMDILDQSGIPTEFDTQVAFEMGQQADRTDPRYWQNMRDDFESMVRQYRNHPAIVLWGLSNEYYVAPHQTNIDHFAAITNDLRTTLDNTRLYLCRGDWMLDFTDVRSYHGAPFADYPRTEVLGNAAARTITLIPNDGYLWTTQPMISIVADKLSERVMPEDKPISLDEDAYLFWMRSMDPLTVLEGENVYSQSTLNAVEDGPKGFVGILNPMNIGSNRFRATVGGWIFEANRLNQIAVFDPHAYGIFAQYDNPKFKERNELYKKMFYDIFAPVTFFVHTFSTHYYADEVPQLRVSLHNDTRFNKRLVLQWSAGSGAVSQRAYNLDPGTMQKDALPIETTLGRVQHRTSVDVDLRLQVEGQQIKELHKSIDIFPRQTGKVAAAVVPLVFDPAGTLGPHLRACGVAYKSVKELTSLPNAKVLLVAPGALPRQDPRVGKTLVEFAKNGGRVVLFHQPDPPTWIPAKLPLIDNSVDSTIAFAAAPAHPILHGLRADDFKFWRGDPDKLLDWNTVALNSYLIPTSGNSVPLLIAGGPQGLAYSPLIEYYVGRGSIVGCQLLLTQKLGREPVADILFRNLIGYATSAPTGRTFVTAGLIAGDNTDGAQAMRQAGLTMAPVAPTALGSAGEPVTFIHAGALPGIDAGALKERLNSGATIFVYGLSTPDQVAGLGAKLGLPLGAAAARRDDLPLSKDAAWEGRPLLQGVNDGQFFWTRDVTMATGGGDSAAMRFNYDRGIADVLLTGTGSANLIGHGDRSVLAEIPVGSGKLILSTLRWDKPLSQDAATRTTQLLGILATNLGIHVNPFGDVVPVDPANTFQVNLRPYVNMGFADDAAGNGKGGWSDEGPTNDMRGMPLGMQTFTDRQIPFDIIDPKTNDGKSIRLLGWRSSHFPSKVTGIAVGRKTAKLDFLQACTYSGEPAKYVVHYADGSDAEIPIDDGAQIVNWWNSAPLTDASAVPIVNDYHLYKTEGNADFMEVEATRYLSCYSWTNPHPDKTIQSIDFETDAQHTRFILVAITGEMAPDR